jgi:hypothetical protein
MSSSEENTMNDHITIEGQDGAFAAYIARPNSGQLGATTMEVGIGSVRRAVQQA